MGWAPSIAIARVYYERFSPTPRRLHPGFRFHLGETETQAERLNECLRLLEAPARAKVCKGMAGLIEEGEEVIREGKRKEQTAADLALIGAAQRVEHYEIAAYTTARNLAVQMRNPTLAQLLTASLGEEQNASQ